MNDIQAKEVIRQVKAMEAEGLVHPTKSAANFPLLLVDKGDRKAPRVCLDLRRLNAEMIQQHFAMPRINTLVNDMARTALERWSTHCLLFLGSDPSMSAA